MCRGRGLAAGVAGSKFVRLESGNYLLVAHEPATRQVYGAIASFLGDKPFRGPQPGTATVTQRIEKKVSDVERNWMVNATVILAAITGVIIFGLEMWRLS